MRAWGVLIGFASVVVLAACEAESTPVTSTPATLPAEVQSGEPEGRSAAMGYALTWVHASDELWASGRSLPRAKSIEADWSPDDEITALLESSAWVLDEVQRLSSLPRCDFDIDREQGVSAELRHLAYMRMSVHALLADAQRLRHAGEADRAAGRIAGALGVARHVGMDLTHVTSRVGAESTLGACRLGMALVEEHELSDEAQRSLLDALERFDVADPFRTREATHAVVELGVAHSALELRGSSKSVEGGFIAIEMGEAPEGGPSKKDLAWIEREMVECRAWAADVVAAMDDPDRPIARLRGISKKTRDGDYGELAQKGLDYSLVPVMQPELEARKKMAELAALLDPH